MKKILFMALLVGSVSAASAQSPIASNPSAVVEQLSETQVRITHLDKCPSFYIIRVESVGSNINTPLMTQGESKVYTVPTTGCNRKVSVEPRSGCATNNWMLEVKCGKALPIKFKYFNVKRVS